jgi:hypothetical protein
MVVLVTLVAVAVVWVILVVVVVAVVAVVVDKDVVEVVVGEQSSPMYPGLHVHSYPIITGLCVAWSGAG